MATYTYQCPNCGALKPVTHKVAETPYIRCNTCTTVMVRGNIQGKKDEKIRSILHK